MFSPGMQHIRGFPTLSKLIGMGAYLQTLVEQHSYLQHCKGPIGDQSWPTLSLLSLSLPPSIPLLSYNPPSQDVDLPVYMTSLYNILVPLFMLSLCQVRK